MTTVVFPQAEVKIFLDATPETRARRRWLELKQKGIERPLAEVLEEIHQRDRQDSTRAESPLQIAPDAVVIDTTDLTIEQVVDRVLEVVKQVLQGQ